LIPDNLVWKCECCQATFPSNVVWRHCASGGGTFSQ
jgi:hypothetical protein